jgi:osmoprotectant transport system ATP-binding protein
MIIFDQVSKVYHSHTRDKDVRAVDDLNLEVSAGELCVLIGPSGSGKTTAMRMVNRLVVPSQGRITIDGQDNSTMDTVMLRRSIGYVIQQVGLFPHLTVADNVAIVPRLVGWKQNKRRERANELLDLVGLPPALFADRYPRQLSGGQQQRVGVARALAADPNIILMDEPFGAVDPITRKQLQRELRRIQAEVHKTIIFVTHDISEAFLLADRIVLMYKGKLVQNGTPAELLRNPASQFVTDFIGEDQGVRTFQYTTLAEIASVNTGRIEIGSNGINDGRDALVLQQDLSIMDGLRHLAARGKDTPHEIMLSDSEGHITGRITGSDLVHALSQALASNEAPGYAREGANIRREADGVPSEAR